MRTKYLEIKEKVCKNIENLRKNQHRDTSHASI